MREIKFRGKRIDNGKWVYGSFVLVDNAFFIIKVLGTTSFDWIEIIPETVGQYTGLIDREGKEIYEGDILKSSYTDFGHKVVFKNGSFLIEHDDICCPPYKTSLVEAQGWQKIIGNIHDDKEL